MREKALSPPLRSRSCHFISYDSITVCPSPAYRISCPGAPSSTSPDQLPIRLGLQLPSSVLPVQSASQLVSVRDGFRSLHHRPTANLVTLAVMAPKRMRTRSMVGRATALRWCSDAAAEGLCRKQQSGGVRGRRSDL